MKWMSRVCAVGLATAVLLSGCGKDKDNKSNNQVSGVDVDYEDYVNRVDREIVTCITEAEITTAMGVTMRLMPNYTAEKANYESEDASYLLTLVLRNMTLDEFNYMAADPTLWKMQVDLGEAAFWNTDQTELVAFKKGYAVSIALNQPDAVAMRRMMEIILSNLE